MSAPDWFDYQAEKVLPKPSYRRPMPALRPEPPSEEITVEESFMDTVRMLAFKLGKRD